MKRLVILALLISAIGCSQSDPVEMPDQADLKTRETANPAINPENKNWEGTTAGK